MKKYKLIKDIPFYKAGEIREPIEWCKIMQVPNLVIFERELERGNLDEWFKEVPSRIELEIYNMGNGANGKLQKKDFSGFTYQEKYLCERALNGELLDIDSLDDDDFSNWYFSEDPTSSICTDAYVKNTGIKAVLKAYLNEKK